VTNAESLNADLGVITFSKCWMDECIREVQDRKGSCVASREEAVCFVCAMDSKQAEFLEGCGIGDVERVRELLGEGVDINTQHQVCVFDEHVF
jgi:hypothetical protein